jgi:hypothetical protein
MKAIQLISLLACLFVSTAVLAQEDSTKSKKPQHIFRRFAVEIGFGNAYFGDKKDSSLAHTGGQNRLSAYWNITDHHSVGIQMLWSFRKGNDSVENSTILASYTFNYFPLNIVPQRDRDVFALFTSIGVGVTTIPTVSIEPAFNPSSEKTSFVIMPGLGARYSHFHGSVNFHFVPGNKEATYLGWSLGFTFGGGVRNKIN